MPNLTPYELELMKKSNNFFNANPNAVTFNPNPAPTGVASISDFSTPSFNPTMIPKVNFTPTVDPSLDFAALMGMQQKAVATAGQPLDARIHSIINPQLPGIRDDVNAFLGQQQDIAKASAVRRNIAGSSTTDLTVNRDLPGQAANMLARNEADLILKATPIAQADRAFEAQTQAQAATFGANLRSMVTDEQFKTMGLQQQQNLAQADADLKRELSSIDQNFQAQMLIAQQNFTAAQNEQDRQLAQQQMAQLNAERQKARQQSFLKGLMTIGGAVGGAYFGGTAGAQVGAAVGNASGDMFSGF